MFLKHIQRGDLENLLELGRIILDRTDEAGTITLDEQAGNNRSNILDRAKFAIRTSLHRAGTDALSRHIGKFPEIKFSVRAYTAAAKSWTEGHTLFDPGAFFDRALAYYPLDETIRTIFIEYCIQSGNSIDRGIEIASKMYTSQPEPQPHLCSLLAALYLHQGSNDKAVTVYGPAYIRRHTGHPDVLNDYAVFWLEADMNLQSSLEAAEISASDSDRHAYWNTLGMIYWKLGRAEDAIRAGERAVMLSNGLIPAYTERLESMKKGLRPPR